MVVLAEPLKQADLSRKIILEWGGLSSVKRLAVPSPAVDRIPFVSCIFNCYHNGITVPFLLSEELRTYFSPYPEPRVVAIATDQAYFVENRIIEMASAEQLKALVKSHIERDDSHFYSVAMQVAAREAKSGHGKLATELRDMIDAAKSSVSLEERRNNPVPLAKPRGEMAGLLSVSYPKDRFVDMVLDQAAADQLQRVLKEQRMFARLREHGLSPRRKVLLVGPPGTGKTMTAAALAGELGIPLFLVRLDTLITKFMGETAAKLRQVFDAMVDIRGVYFFDEFDAIGSQRGMPNDVGEIRRVLNSFLMMIEEDQSNSLIIAATNHPEILDYALFRRFDDVIEYHLPTAEQASSLIRTRLGSFAPKPFSAKTVGEQAVGLSYAEIRRAVDDAIKDAIMQDEDRVKGQTLGKAMMDRRLLSQKLAKQRSSESCRIKESSSVPT